MEHVFKLHREHLNANVLRYMQVFIIIMDDSNSSNFFFYLGTYCEILVNPCVKPNTISCQTSNNSVSNFNCKCSPNFTGEVNQNSSY